MAGRLTDDKMAEIARNVAASKMESIALGFLKVDGDKVEALKDYHRGKSEPFNIDILKEWRNQNSGGNEIERLAVLLHQSATKGSYINLNKVEDILKISKKQAEELEKTLDQSPGAGTGTGPAPIPVAPAGASPAGQSGKTKLTDGMIINLAECFGKEGDLRKFGTTGLNLKGAAVERQISNHHRSVIDAVNAVITDWLKSQEDRYVAYTELCAALRASGFVEYIKEAWG